MVYQTGPSKFLPKGHYCQNPTLPLWKKRKLWKDPPWRMGKSTITMAIFQFANCNKLPEGYWIFKLHFYIVGIKSPQLFLNYSFPCNMLSAGNLFNPISIRLKTPLFVGWIPPRFWWIFLLRIPSGYVKIAIENGHWNGGFSHEQWWFSSSLC